MKKLTLILVIIAALFMGCSKKKKSTEPNYGFNENLIGYWILTSYADEDGPQEYTGYLDITTQQTFTGQFVDEDGIANYSGKIESESNNIKIIVQNSDALWIEQGTYILNYAVTSTSLDIDGVMDDEYIDLSYSKNGGENDFGDLSGSVINSIDGEPIQNALVDIQNTAFTIYSNTSGNFLIENIPVGSYTVQITKTGFVTHTENIIIEKDNTIYKIFELVPETSGIGTLSGFVADVLNQTPIAGASITINGTNFSATSSGNGVYIISNIPVGTYDVTCSKSGYETQITNDVMITDNDETEIDFLLLPEGTTNYGALSGVVYSQSNGEPIGNVIVQVVGLYNSAATSNDGSYLLALIPEGTYQISFTKPGYETLTVDNVQIVSNEEVTLDAELVQIAGSGSLVVTAATPLSLPVSGVLVELLDTNISGTTGNFGVCTIQNIPAGMYTVRVSKTGYSTQEFDNIEILSGLIQYIDVIMQ